MQSELYARFDILKDVSFVTKPTNKVWTNLKYYFILLNIIMWLLYIISILIFGIFRMRMMLCLYFLFCNQQLYRNFSREIRRVERCPSRAERLQIRKLFNCTSNEVYHCLLDEDGFLKETCNAFIQLPPGKLMCSILFDLY